MSAPVTSNRIRIAIVDDHPLFRAGLATSLRRAADLEIVMVGETAEDAIRAAASGKIDVLLLDITIPGNGIDAARSIVRDNPGMKILFLTGSDSEDAAAETLAIGGRGYVLKGANGRELVKAIRTVHQGQLYVTPELATRMLARQGRREPAAPVPDRPEPHMARPCQAAGSGRSSTLQPGGSRIGRSRPSLGSASPRSSTTSAWSYASGASATGSRRSCFIAARRRSPTSPQRPSGSRPDSASTILTC
jgi:DNA-binding NarL/FixJ family response regulator